MTGFLTRSCRRGVWMVGLGAALAVGIVAGCSSGSSSNTSATTRPGAGAASTTTGTGGDQSKQLNNFAAALKSGKQATFKAVYTYSGSGSSGTVTIEQKPPKTVFIAGGGEVIGTGTTTYFCSTGSTPTCLSSGTTNPLAALTQLFNPDNAVTAIQQAESAAAAHTAGYDVSFSTQSFAGLDAECVTVAAQGQTGKYCVTKTGILAYSGTATENFVLTSFSSNVSDSAFSLPAGASTVTLPPGVTIPGVP